MPYLCDTFATWPITSRIATIITFFRHTLFIYFTMAAFFISPRVIDTINSLPLVDRLPITNALSAELILGQDPTESLTPMQNILYAMIRFYITQDTDRNRRIARDAYDIHSASDRRVSSII